MATEVYKLYGSAAFGKLVTCTNSVENLQSVEVDSSGNVYVYGVCQPTSIAAATITFSDISGNTLNFWTKNDSTTSSFLFVAKYNSTLTSMSWCRIIYRNGVGLGAQSLNINPYTNEIYISLAIGSGTAPLTYNDIVGNALSTIATAPPNNGQATAGIVLLVGDSDGNPITLNSAYPSGGSFNIRAGGATFDSTGNAYYHITANTSITGQSVVFCDDTGAAQAGVSLLAANTGGGDPTLANATFIVKVNGDLDYQWIRKFDVSGIYRAVVNVADVKNVVYHAASDSVYCTLNNTSSTGATLLMYNGTNVQQSGFSHTMTTTVQPIIVNLAASDGAFISKNAITNGTNGNMICQDIDIDASGNIIGLCNTNGTSGNFVMNDASGNAIQTFGGSNIAGMAFIFKYSPDLNTLSSLVNRIPSFNSTAPGTNVKLLRDASGYIYSLTYSSAARTNINVANDRTSTSITTFSLSLDLSNNPVPLLLKFNHNLDNLQSGIRFDLTSQNRAVIGRSITVYNDKLYFAGGTNITSGSIVLKDLYTGRTIGSTSPTNTDVNGFIAALTLEPAQYSGPGLYDASGNQLTNINGSITGVNFKKNATYTVVHTADFQGLRFYEEPFFSGSVDQLYPQLTATVNGIFYTYTFTLPSNLTVGSKTIMHFRVYPVYSDGVANNGNFTDYPAITPTVVYDTPGVWYNGGVTQVNGSTNMFLDKVRTYTIVSATTFAGLRVTDGLGSVNALYDQITPLQSGDMYTYSFSLPAGMTTFWGADVYFRVYTVYSDAQADNGSYTQYTAASARVYANLASIPTNDTVTRNGSTHIVASVEAPLINSTSYNQGSPFFYRLSKWSLINLDTSSQVVITHNGSTFTFGSQYETTSVYATADPTPPLRVYSLERTDSSGTYPADISTNGPGVYYMATGRQYSKATGQAFNGPIVAIVRFNIVSLIGAATPGGLSVDTPLTLQSGVTYTTSYINMVNGQEYKIRTNNYSPANSYTAAFLDFESDGSNNIISNGTSNLLFTQPTGHYSPTLDFTNPAAISLTFVADPSPTIIGDSIVVDSFASSITDASNIGVTVAEILADISYSDLNINIGQGIGIIGISGTADNLFQYKLHGDVSWSDLSSGVTLNNAFLLDASDSIRMSPLNEFFGNASVQIVGWDKTIGTAGTFTDASYVADGAFSQNYIHAVFNVYFTNTSPVITSGQTVIFPQQYKNIVTTGRLISSIIDDISGAITHDDISGLGIAVVGVPSSSIATAEYKLAADVSWNVLTSTLTSALLLGPTDSIRIVSNNDYSGNASVTFKLWDQNSGVRGQTVNATFTSGGSFSQNNVTLTATFIDPPASASSAVTDAIADISNAAIYVESFIVAQQSAAVSSGDILSSMSTAIVNATVEQRTAIVEAVRSTILASTAADVQSISGGKIVTISDDPTAFANFEATLVTSISGLAQKPVNIVIPDFTGGTPTITFDSLATGSYIKLFVADGEQIIINADSTQVTATYYDLSVNSYLTISGENKLVGDFFTVGQKRYRIAGFGSVTIEPSNPPVVSSSQTVSYTPILSNISDAGNKGRTVASYFTTELSGEYYDVDTNPLKGIAITSTSSNTHGYFQYKLDASSSWVSISGVSSGSALVLDPSAIIRFVPSETYTTNNSFSFKIWDQTDGAIPGTLADSTYQTLGAYSQNSVVAEQIVLDVIGIQAIIQIAVSTNDTIENVIDSLVNTSVNSNSQLINYIASQSSTSTGSITVITNYLTVTFTEFTAPVLAGSAAVPVGTIYEDIPDEQNTGYTVSSITDHLGADYNDSNLVVNKGIYISDVGSYAFEYKTASTDASWTAISLGSGQVLLLDTSGMLRFVPTLHFVGTAAFTFGLWNTFSGTTGTVVTLSSLASNSYSTATRTAEVDVTNLNDAPVLNNTPTISLTSIYEDITDASNNGQQVIDICGLLGNNYLPIDPDALFGVAIIGQTIDTSSGYWQYRNNLSSSWNDFGSTSAASALLLDDQTYIRFQPTSAYSGIAEFTFKVWDQTAGGNGTTVDTTTYDPSGAFSQGTATTRIVISNVNDAPILSGNPVHRMPVLSILESSLSINGVSIQTIMNEISGGIVDEDTSFANLGIVLTGYNDGGGWQYKSSSSGVWTEYDLCGADAGLVIPLDASGYIRFVPVAGSPGVKNLYYRLWDGSLGTTATPVALDDIETSYSSGAGSVYQAVTPDTTSTLYYIQQKVTVEHLNSTTFLDNSANIPTLTANLATAYGITASKFALVTYDHGADYVDLVTAFVVDSADNITTKAQLFLDTSILSNATLLSYLATQSSTSSGSITAVQAINDLSFIAVSAPTITGSITIPNIDEDVDSLVNTGVTVASMLTLFGGAYGDSNPVVNKGLIIIGDQHANGKWQFKTASGGSWSDVSLNNSESLPLAAAAYIRFLPNLNINGVVNISVKAWNTYDGTSGTYTLLADLYSNTYSTGDATVVLNIDAVNDAPVLNSPVDVIIPTITSSITDTSNVGITVATVLSTIGAAYNDVDSAAVSGILLTNVSANGWEYKVDENDTWHTYTTTNVAANAVIPLTLSGYVRFVPALFGTIGGFSLTYKVWDQTSGAAGTSTTLGALGSSYSIGNGLITQAVAPNNTNVVYGINLAFNVVGLNNTTFMSNNTVQTTLKNYLADALSITRRKVAFKGFKYIVDNNGTYEYVSPIVSGFKTYENNIIGGIEFKTEKFFIVQESNGDLTITLQNPFAQGVNFFAWSGSAWSEIVKPYKALNNGESFTFSASYFAPYIEQDIVVTSVPGTNGVPDAVTGIESKAWTYVV